MCLCLFGGHITWCANNPLCCDGCSLLAKDARNTKISNKRATAIIQQLAAQGKGVILISSELPELLGISDRIYTIFEGQITNDLPVEEATPENLMRSMTSSRPKAKA